MPHNSLIISLRGLGKYTFSLIMYYSAIEIDLYSFYRKNLIDTLKLREKTNRTPYSFTKKR